MIISKHFALNTNNANHNTNNNIAHIFIYFKAARTKQDFFVYSLFIKMEYIY